MPNPTPEALVAKWRGDAEIAEFKAEHAHSVGLDDAAVTGWAKATAMRACADELESALASREPAGVPKAAPGAVPTMADAVAAGDGTLHGAIDHWQERALKSEAALSQSQSAQDGGGEVVAWHVIHEDGGSHVMMADTVDEKFRLALAETGRYVRPMIYGDTPASPAAAAVPEVSNELEARCVDAAASMLNDNNGKIGKRHFKADATAVVRRVLRVLAAAQKDGA